MTDKEVPAPRTRIFLSYRRVDAGHAGRLYDALVEELGEESVFMDITAIAPGSDFTQAIETALADCETTLVLIGPSWTRMTDQQGRRRLDDPDDLVVLEIHAALRGDIRVLPVLVGGAKMPSITDLPSSIADLARRHAFELSERRWHPDVGELIAEIRKGEKAQTASRRKFARLPEAIEIQATATGAGNTACLDVMSHDGRGLVPLLVDHFHIGRASDNDLVLDDDGMVSRRHAEVVRDTHGWLLRDLGSTNGSFVNEKPAGAGSRLRDGDEIRLGRTRLHFRLVHEDSETIGPGDLRGTKVGFKDAMREPRVRDAGHRNEAGPR
jgi:hypothetical protein